MDRLKLIAPFHYLRYFASSLFLLTMASCLSAQSFAPIGAKWYYESNDGFVPPNAEYWLYESKNSANCAGIPCSRISITCFKYNGDTVYLPDIYLFQSNDTVYHFSAPTNTSHLLYVFNVSVGDSIKFPVFNISSPPFEWTAVVDSVTNITVNNQSLQKIVISSLGYQTYNFGYVEKIGCLDRLLPQPEFPWVEILEHDGPLRCYVDNNTLYQSSSLPCDYRIVTGMGSITGQGAVQIYPNPCAGTFSLINGRSLEGITMYNSQGEIALQKIFHRDFNRMNIDIPTSIANGFYIVKGFGSAGNFQSTLVLKR